MEAVKASHNLGAWKLATKQPRANGWPDYWDSLDHSVNNSQTVTGEQVVWERVAGEPSRHAQDEEHEANHPVELAWFAESASEEYAKHV